MADSTTTSDDRDRLWAPRTLAFFTAIILANLVVDFAAIAGHVVGRAGLSGGWPTRYLSGFLEGLLFGLFFAQIVGLAIWTALFPGNSMARWLAGTLVVFGGTVCLALPIEAETALVYYLHEQVYDASIWQFLSEALADSAYFLMLFYVAQVPFWLQRRISHMRFTRDPRLTVPNDGALRIVDLFSVVAFVAIMMSLARLAAPEIDQLQFVAMVATVSVPMWIFGAAFLIVVFRVQSRAIRIFACLALGQLFAWSFAMFILFAEPGQRGGVPVWRFYVVICQGIGLGIVALALANGEAARAYGYRLVGSPFWRRGKSADAPTTTAPPAASPPP